MSDGDPAWLIQDTTFEKMGVNMAQNNGRLLALFDELSSFLTKLKLCSSKGLADSHEFNAFLELYNANEWTRSTGMYKICCAYGIYNIFSVAGDANFSMDVTSLTVDGFNQPAVARSLIELTGKAESGFSQRFLWFFPKPVYGKFHTYDIIDEDFVDRIGINIVCHIQYG